MTATRDTDQMAEFPESPHAVKRFDGDRWAREKLEAWGVDPSAAVESVVSGESMGTCGENGCAGQWCVIDQSGPVWIVECDECGFVTGTPPQDEKVAAAARLRRSGLPDRFIGLQFDEDEENRDALEFCRAWLAEFGADQARLAGGDKTATPGLPAICLFGSPHSGKTHLATQLCVQLIRKCRANVMFRPVRELLRELQRFDNDVQRTETWERAVNVDVLALDDLGAERITDWRLEQLAELIDARYLACKPILLTTNYPPSSWADDEILDERSRDRLLRRGMVIPLLLKGRDRRQAQPEREGES